MPTRRAFLFAGGTFALGVSAGGACGYAMGVSAGRGPSGQTGRSQSDNQVEEELLPTGDADLDFLRHLAVKAPINELVQQRMMFVNATFMDYPTDRVMWRGVGRLCDFLLEGGRIDNRSQFARALASVIEKAEPTVSSSLKRHVDALRRLK